MTSRALIIVSAMLLSACTAQRPYDEIGICLTDVNDLATLKAVTTHVATQFGASVEDNSRLVSRDLAAIDSPISAEPLLVLLIEDPKWLSDFGLVIVSNIGTASPKSVRVALFRNSDLLGTNDNTEKIRRDLISATSARWQIVDTPSSDGAVSGCVR